MIVAAAKDRDISAVISQVPFVDSFSTVGRMNFKFMMQATFAGLRDVLRKLTFRVPYCVPVVGAPHTFALMNTPDAQSGFMSLVPEGSSWKNECPARVMFTLLCYRPLMYAHKVACPVLIIIAENDSLISEKAIEKTANRILRGTILRLPVGHFDVYGGDEFETLVESQIQFLKCCLQRTGDYSTHS